MNTYAERARIAQLILAQINKGHDVSTDARRLAQMTLDVHVLTAYPADQRDGIKTITSMSECMYTQTKSCLEKNQNRPEAWCGYCMRVVARGFHEFHSEGGLRPSHCSICERHSADAIHSSVARREHAIAQDRR